MDLCSNIFAIEYGESYYKISHSMIVRQRSKNPPKHMLRLTTKVSIGVRKPCHRGLPKNSDAFPVAVTLLDKVTISYKKNTRSDYIGLEYPMSCPQ